MQRLIEAVARFMAALLLLATVAGCGGDCRAILSSGLIVSCANAPPGPDDPAFGDAAQVLVADQASGNLIWVGINGDTGPGSVFANFESLYCSDTLSWIGGTVVVATDRPLDFFFDPNSILVAEVVAAGQQTTIDAIASDPLAFEPPPGSNVQWAVPADVLSVEVTATGMVGGLVCPTPTPPSS